MSLRADLCGYLWKFENHLSIKHMDTKTHIDESTGNADNRPELRTISGQVNIAFEARSRDEVIERLCMKVFGAYPVYTDPVPTPPAERPKFPENHLVEEGRIFGMKVHVTKAVPPDTVVIMPPAERKTPETDAMPSRVAWFGTDDGEVEVVRRSDVSDLELQLAEAREQRDRLADLAEKFLADFDGEIHCDPKCICTKRRIARENRAALAAVKEQTPADAPILPPGVRGYDCGNCGKPVEPTAVSLKADGWHWHPQCWKRFLGGL